MNNNDLRDVDLPTFVDAKGDAYYQQSHVENQLLGGRKLNGLVSNSSRRHATPFEMPALKRLCMRTENQRGSLGVTLLRVDAVKDMLVSGTVSPTQRTSKPQSNKTIGLKKPPFSTVKLVAQALLTSSLGGLTRLEIEKWFSRQYSYYHSTRPKWAVANALSKCEFFSTQPNRKWYIKEEYRSYLNENAHIPDYVKKIEWSGYDSLGMGPTSATTIGPKQYQPQTTFVSEGSEITAEFPQEVEILPGKNQYVAFDPSVKTKHHQNRPHQAANLIDASTKKTEPRISNTVNLVNTVNASPPKKTKMKTIVDIKEDDEMSSNDISQLTERNITKTTVQCPICDAEFNSKESLGDHVSSHRKAPLDPTKIAKDAIQNVASLFGGQMTNRDSSPIFVFSGNVYFSSNPPAS